MVLPRTLKDRLRTLQLSLDQLCHDGLSSMLNVI